MGRLTFFVILPLLLSSISWGSDLYPELDVADFDRENFEELYNDLEEEKEKSFDSRYEGITPESQRGKVLGKVALNPESLEEAYSLSHKNIPKGERAYTFNFYGDGQFKAKNNSLFNTIFESSESTKVGPLIIGYESFFSKPESFVRFGYLVSFGINFFQGTAPSSTNSGTSLTKLTLWVAPVNVGANMRLNVSSLLGFKFFGGVSFAGMIQSRSDYRDDESGKNVNRLGQGLFGGLASDFSLGQYFSKYQSELFDNYGFTNFRLSLNFRYQDLSFNGESDELDFSGSSIGLGVSFDSI